jgi:hypothetical protein
MDEFFLKRESYNQPNFKGLAGRCVQSLYKQARLMRDPLFSPRENQVDA